MVTATGLGSGLDVGSLVSQLLAADRAGADLQLTRETNKLKTKLSAFGSLKSTVAGLQSSLGGLNMPANFGKKSITSSNTTALTATAGSSAVPNTYALEVTQLAKAHSLASPAFAATNTAIGTGTLTFRFGTTGYNAGTDTYSSFTLNPDTSITTLTIDSSNNTLGGIMTAINDAKFGVKASIVNDGTGNRLLLTSEQTGLQNSLEVSVADVDNDDTDAGATAGLSNFAFNALATNLAETSAAGNAAFKVNGLSVASQSNTVTTAIPGVSLFLKEVTTQPVNVAVQADNSAVVNAFSTFVASYNSFRTTVNTLTGYNAATNTAGTLLGDFTVRSIISQVESILRNDVEGVPGEVTNLADLGLKTNSSGGYVLDVEKFKAALTESPQGIASLFAALGAPTHEDVSYGTSTLDTKTGNYAVVVTAAATAGSLAGAGVLPDFGLGDTLEIDSGNDALTLSVDGVAAGAVTLTHGVYSSGASLASEMQSRINGAAAMVAAGKSITVSYDEANARLVLTSPTYGDSSVIDISATGIDTAATLGLSIGAGTAGSDVAGTINGAAATGAGQLLTSTTGVAKGLGLFINGSTTGAKGSVNFTRGISDQLSQLLTQVLDDEGSIEQRIDSIEERQEAVEAKRARLEIKWKAVEARYLAQFNALDSLLTQLQSTSSYLEGQLASLPKPPQSRS